MQLFLIHSMDTCTRIQETKECLHHVPMPQKLLHDVAHVLLPEAFEQQNTEKVCWSQFIQQTPEENFLVRSVGFSSLRKAAAELVMTSDVAARQTGANAVNATPSTNLPTCPWIQGWSCPMHRPRHQHQSWLTHEKVAVANCMF